MQIYNSGNVKKYNTKNPLKRLLVDRLNQRIIKEIALLIDKKEQVKILDAGCGEGFISRMIVSAFPGVVVTGLDYTNEALEIAREMGEDVTYVQGDIMDMPFENKEFDIVVCTEVLEHLDDPDKAHSELLRVSKWGVLVTVPHEPWFCIGNMAALKNLSRFGNPIDHINRWSFGSFKEFIGKKSRNAVFGKSFPWSIARIHKIHEDKMGRTDHVQSCNRASDNVLRFQPILRHAAQQE